MGDVRVRAFAKINLSLRVIGTRPDGYHELRTVFQSIALHDVLTIRRRRGEFRLSCTDAACPSGRTNLVWRAAAHVWAAAGNRGAPRDLDIHLLKRIPMQAGLGGGSSDAAATIRALGAALKVDEVRQRAIAAALGADVPYFLEGGTVLGLERGDLLFPLEDEPPAWVVLAVPAFGISTKDAFAWADERRPTRRSGARPAHARPDDGVNDLERPVVRRHPEIGRLIRTLSAAGARLAAMSGSGSAVFGLFDSRAGARRGHDAVAGLKPVTKIVVTRTLTRRACRRLAVTKPIG